MNTAFLIRFVALLAAHATASVAATNDDLSSFPDRPNRLAPGLLSEDETRAVPPVGTPIRPVGSSGLNLTEQAEGWEPRLYNDAAGFCTIGYGHLIKKLRCDGTEAAEFQRGITKPIGARILTEDMTQAEIVVMTSVSAQLNEAQYSALCDFVFNVGRVNFRSSTLLKRVNASEFGDVPAQLRRWTKAGGRVFPGLVKRRNAEIDLFFAGQSIPRPVPSPDEDLSPIDILLGEPVR